MACSGCSKRKQILGQSMRAVQNGQAQQAIRRLAVVAKSTGKTIKRVVTPLGTRVR